MDLQLFLYQLFYTEIGLLDKVWKLMVVSISAQLTTLPFVIFYFHQFPNFFWITNLIVIPLAFIIVGLAVLISLIYSMFGSHFMLGDLMNIAVKGLNYSVEIITLLPFSVSKNIWINEWSFVFLLFSITAVIVFVRLVQTKWLILSLLCLLCFGIVETWSSFKNNTKQEIVIYQAKKTLLSYTNCSEAKIYTTQGSRLVDAQQHLYAEGKQKIQELNINTSSLFQLADRLILLTNKLDEINTIGPFVDVVLLNTDSLKKEPFIADNVVYIDYRNIGLRGSCCEGSIYELQKQGYLKVLSE